MGRKGTWAWFLLFSLNEELGVDSLFFSPSFGGESWLMIRAKQILSYIICGCVQNGLTTQLYHTISMLLFWGYLAGQYKFTTAVFPESNHWWLMSLCIEKSITGQKHEVNFTIRLKAVQEQDCVPIRFSFRHGRQMSPMKRTSERFMLIPPTEITLLSLWGKSRVLRLIESEDLEGTT